MEIKRVWSLKIIAIIFLIILLIALIHRFVLFGFFRKNVRPMKDGEKREALRILNKSLELENAEIKFGMVGSCSSGEESLAYLTIIGKEGKENYVVDLEKNKILEKSFGKF